MSPRLGEHPLSFHHKLNFLKSFPLFIFSGDSCPFARKSQKKSGGGGGGGGNLFDRQTLNCGQQYEIINGGFKKERESHE
jgi:hypothetical protein